MHTPMQEAMILKFQKKNRIRKKGLIFPVIILLFTWKIIHWKDA